MFAGFAQECMAGRLHGFPAAAEGLLFTQKVQPYKASGRLCICAAACAVLLCEH